MNILAHRGWWLTQQEKNTSLALSRAFEHGYGVETDLRDDRGQVVVSHDPPARADLMSLEELLALHAGRSTLALNIKADGLQEPLMAALAEAHVTDYFVFDMAVPDALGYLRRGAITYTRHSEYETVPAFYDRADGVWLDAFESEWFAADVIERHLAVGKRVALVSPELHGRPHAAAWETWRRLAHAVAAGSLTLCTDFPDQADRYFHG